MLNDRNGSNLMIVYGVHELYLWVTGPECHLETKCGGACFDYFTFSFDWCDSLDGFT